MDDDGESVNSDGDEDTANCGGRATKQWQQKWSRMNRFGFGDLSEKGVATDKEMVMRTKMMVVVGGQLNSGKEDGGENNGFNRRCRKRSRLSATAVSFGVKEKGEKR